MFPKFLKLLRSLSGAIQYLDQLRGLGKISFSDRCMNHKIRTLKSTLTKKTVKLLFCFVLFFSLLFDRLEKAFKCFLRDRIESRTDEIRFSKTFLLLLGAR